MPANPKNIHFKRLGREFALQFLFQFDITNGDSSASLRARSALASTASALRSPCEVSPSAEDLALQGGKPGGKSRLQRRRNGYESALEYFWEQFEQHEDINDVRSFSPRFTGKAGRKGKLFAEKLIHGVIDNKEKVDSIISKFAEKWTMERMAVVDRNVLRIAVYEMLYCPDIPPVVSINEAIEIVKAFGGEDSGGFINGILNSVKDSLDRPARKGIG